MRDRRPRRPLHYAWLIVIVTFVTLITTAGFRATPGVLIVPMQKEFGWSRQTISVGISLGLLMFGLGTVEADLYTVGVLILFVGVVGVVVLAGEYLSRYLARRRPRA